MINLLKAHSPIAQGSVYSRPSFGNQKFTLKLFKSPKNNMELSKLRNDGFFAEKKINIHKIPLNS